MYFKGNAMRILLLALSILFATVAYAQDTAGQQQLLLNDKGNVIIGTTTATGETRIIHNGTIVLTTTSGGVDLGASLTTDAIANAVDIDVDIDSTTVATFDSGGLVPGTDNTYDLGTASLEWRDIHVDRIGYIDTLASVDATVTGTFNAGNTTGFEVANGTDLPDSPLAGYMFLDTNDGACDDANDSGGTAVCLYNGSAWILLGNTGS